jgi:hypothetical protein
VIPEQIMPILVAASKDSVDINTQTYPYREVPECPPENRQKC